MKNNNNLEYLSPDLYLRYHYGFEIIKNLQKNQPCQILDVGGRGGIMGNFIKKEKLPYSLTIIDDLPDNKSKTICDKYIRQNFLSFNVNQKFDYVVNFDVLEHIQEKKVFVEKCLSLCDTFIITAPFKSKYNNMAENIVDQYFLKYKNIHHPWLIEHFKQGLPELTWLKNFLRSNKINFQILNSNNIENWVNFMLPNLISTFFPTNIKKLEKINQFYNKNYKELGDTISPTYRKIIIASSKKLISIPKEFSSQDYKYNIQKKNNFY